MGVLERWDRRNQRTMEDHAARDPVGQPPTRLEKLIHGADLAKAIVVGFVFVAICFIALAQAIIDQP